MSKRLVSAGLAVVLAVVLSGCQIGNLKKGIKMAEARDMIWGVEKEDNGLYQVWFRYDSIAVYCTADKSLGEEARTLLHDGTQAPEVFFTYRDFVEGDPELSLPTGDWTYACGQGFTDTLKYKLLSIALVSGR